MNLNWILKNCFGILTVSPVEVINVEIFLESQSEFLNFLIQTFKSFSPLKMNLNVLTSQLRNYSEWNVKFFLFFRDFSLIWPRARSFFICNQFEMLILREKILFHRVLADSSSTMYVHWYLRRKIFFWCFICLKSSSTPTVTRKKIYTSISFHKLFNLINKHTKCTLYSIYFFVIASIVPCHTQKSIKFIRVNIN